MKQKQIVMLVLLGFLAIFLFGKNETVHPTQTIMSIEFGDVVGWWAGLSSIEQGSVYLIGGVLLLIFIINWVWKE